MAVDPSDVRERAWVEYREPATATVEDPTWVAEDPDTECMGIGRVKAEAVGNLVAAVAEFEESRAGTGEAAPLLKVPGTAVTRPSARDGTLDSLADTLESLF